jgi:putative intracellular protease/amidase
VLLPSGAASAADRAVYDTLADWEVGYLLVELRTGRFTGSSWNVVTVSKSHEPITTMGGLRIMPDMILDDLDPAESDLLILPGADMWDVGGGEAFTTIAARFLDSGVPVAAICGATAGLARAGLLDTPPHQRGSRISDGDGIRRRGLLRRRTRGRGRGSHHRWPHSRPCSLPARPCGVSAWPPATEELRNTLTTMRHLVALLEADQSTPAE